MSTIWNYLKGGKKSDSAAPQSAVEGNTSSPIPQNALELLLSETATTGQMPTIREGKSYLAPPQQGASVPSGPSPTCVATLVGHTDRIWGLAWHPSGDILVSCGGDKTARFWMRSVVGSPAFAQEEKDAATGSSAPALPEEGQAAGWRCVHTINSEHSGTVRTAAWSGDGSRVALCSFDGTVSIWVVTLLGGEGTLDDGAANVPSDDEGEEEGNSFIKVRHEVTLDGHESEVKGVAWFADSYNYNYMNDLHLARLAAAEQSTKSDEDDSVVSAAGEAIHRVVANASQRLIAQLGEPTTTLTNARRPLQLATCSRDRSVWIWEGKAKTASRASVSGSLYPTIVQPATLGVDYECAGVLTGHPQDIKSVSWVPSSVYLGPTGPIVSSSEEEASAPHSSHTGLPPAGLVASGGLLSCSYDDTVRVWEEHRVRKDDWDCVQTLAGHDGTVWEAAVQPTAEISERISVSNNQLLEWAHALPTNPIVVTASDDGRLVAWQRSYEGAKANYSQVGSVGGFADGRTLFSVSWCPAHPSSIIQKGSQAPSGSQLESSFTLNVSDVVAVGTGDDSIALFRLVPITRDGNVESTSRDSIRFEPLATVAHAHNGEVNCVRFSPAMLQGTAELASASDDGEIKIWSMAL